MSTSRITHDDHPPLPNGRPGKHSSTRANGHAKESTSAENAPQISAPQARARAAADDARGTPDAPASAPPAASANRAGDAAAARDSKHHAGEEVTPNGANLREEAAAKAEAKSAARAAGKAEREAAKRLRTEKAPPLAAGTAPLPMDHHAFTEALHAKIDFLEVGKKLLNSSDEKIVKGVWEHMLELRYGQEAATSDDAQRIVIDMPRPKLHDSFAAPNTPDHAPDHVQDLNTFGQ